MLKQLKLLFFTAILSTVTTSANAGSEVGEAASNFTVKRLDGTEFRLSDYRGEKMVNLIFWATWCPVCQAEIPAITSFHEDYGSEVEVLALAVNASARPIPAYVEKHALSYPVAIDTSRKVMSEYNITGTPTQILIDKDGVIIYRDGKTPDFLMESAAE